MFKFIKKASVINKNSMNKINNGLKEAKEVYYYKMMDTYTIITQI